MSKFKLLVLVLVLLFQGCYIKLATIDHIAAQNDAECHLTGRKFSYHVYVLDGQNDGTVEKALIDSLSACAVKDVVESEKIEYDRINLFVYIHNDRSDVFTRYLAFPGQFVSLATLFIVPHYEGYSTPIETHVIVPKKGHDYHFTIINEEYKLKDWVWLPFLFASKDTSEGGKDAYYYTWDGSKRRAQLKYLGYRRVFDRVIMQSVNN